MGSVASCRMMMRATCGLCSGPPDLNASDLLAFKPLVYESHRLRSRGPASVFRRNRRERPCGGARRDDISRQNLRADDHRSARPQPGRRSEHRFNLQPSDVEDDSDAPSPPGGGETEQADTCLRLLFGGYGRVVKLFGQRPGRLALRKATAAEEPARAPNAD